MKTKNNISGFTLIELAIVLVIVGLLISGVLTGRSLIEAAEFNNIISQYAENERAINAFRLKYNCLPGDCKKLTSFGIDYAGFNGNGNGLVDIEAEAENFWQNLVNSGLIKENKDPSLPYACNRSPCLPEKFKTEAGKQGGWWALYSNIYIGSTVPTGKNIYWLTYQPHVDGDADILTGDQAYFIDEKMDDGMPYTGNVTVAGYYAGDTWGPMPLAPVAPDSPGAEVENCTIDNDPLPSEYNLTNTTRTFFNMCSLVIKANF